MSDIDEYAGYAPDAAARIAALPDATMTVDIISTPMDAQHAEDFHVAIQKMEQCE